MHEDDPENALPNDTPAVKLSVIGLDDQDGGPAPNESKRPRQSGSEPPLGPHFKTMRVVWIDVRGLDEPTMEELLAFLAEEGIEPITPGKTFGTTHYCGYHLPNQARKIETWMRQRDIRRENVYVDGSKIEP